MDTPTTISVASIPRDASTQETLRYITNQLLAHPVGEHLIEIETFGDPPINITVRCGDCCQMVIGLDFDESTKSKPVDEVVEYEDGSKWWYRNGRLHRDDGPAIDYGPEEPGEEWFRNGRLHRDDGPAIDHGRDGSTLEWWIDGQQLTKAEFARRRG